MFGGCSGFYGHPAINATMSLLPEIAQPGGYKDYKNEEIRELRKEISRLRRNRNNQIPEFKEGDIYKIGDTTWINQGPNKWILKTSPGVTTTNSKIIGYANNSGEPIMRKVNGKEKIIYICY